jgi:molecular chaperone DnaK
VRKSVKEMGDKLDVAEKEKIEAAIKDLEAVSRSDDQEDIKKKTDALLEASHKLAEQMYAQAQAKAKAEESAGAAETSGADKGDANEKENVVDAEFEEVKENKGKK